MQVYRAMYPLHAVRAQELRWDGPECVEGLQLDSVKRCPQAQPNGDSKAADAADSKGAAAAKGAAGKQQAATGAKAAGKGKAAAAAGGGDAATKASSGSGKDNRRLRR